MALLGARTVTDAQMKTQDIKSLTARRLAAKKFAQDVLQKRLSTQNTRSSVLDVLGLEPMYLEQKTGLERSEIQKWMMKEGDHRPTVHRRIISVLTVSYLEKYGPAADEELPPFEGL